MLIYCAEGLKCFHRANPNGRLRTGETAAPRDSSADSRGAPDQTSLKPTRASGAITRKAKDSTTNRRISLAVWL